LAHGYVGRSLLRLILEDTARLLVMAGLFRRSTSFQAARKTAWMRGSSPHVASNKLAG
jgi:hypothetical protein